MLLVSVPKPHRTQIDFLPFTSWLALNVAALIPMPSATPVSPTLWSISSTTLNFVSTKFRLSCNGGTVQLLLASTGSFDFSTLLLWRNLLLSLGPAKVLEDSASPPKKDSCSHDSLADLSETGKAWAVGISSEKLTLRLCLAPFLDPLSTADDRSWTSTCSPPKPSVSPCKSLLGNKTWWQQQRTIKTSTIKRPKRLHT